MTTAEMRFPKDKVGQKASRSSVGAGMVYEATPFPKIGLMYQEAMWVELESGDVWDPFRVLATTPAPGEPIHIGDRARALAGVLVNLGVNGKRYEDLYVDEAGEDDVNPGEKFGSDPDYAYLEECHCTDEACYEGYFDHESLMFDFQDFVKKFFADDPTVKVCFDYDNVGVSSIEFERAKS